MDADFVTPKSFDASKITLGAVRINPNTKSKTINIGYGDKPFVIKVPKMYIPVVWDKDETNTKFTIEMSFKGEETNEPLAAFRAMLASIDEVVLGKAQERSMEWFKKTMTRETCEFMYSTVVKQPNDPAYAPTFKVTLYKRNDKFDFGAFDENKEKIEISDPHKLKGCHAMALIQCTGVWMAGAKFGTTWKLKQIRIFPKAARDTVGSLADRVTPLVAEDFNSSAITFSSPKQTANGGKTIYINNNERPLVIQTPKMHSPFGMSVWHDEHGTKLSIELSFKDMESESSIGAFHNFVVELETMVKAESSTANWFKGVSASYSSVIRQNNTQYPATIKFTVPSTNGAISIPVFNAETNEEMTINEENINVFKGGKVSIVASCSGVWNHGTRFGISFRALKIFINPAVFIKDYSLGDDADEVTDNKLADDIKRLAVTNEDGDGETEDGDDEDVKATDVDDVDDV